MLSQQKLYSSDSSEGAQLTSCFKLMLILFFNGDAKFYVGFCWIIIF